MKKVILIGGGHSLKEGIEKDLWSKIKDKEIWSTNYAFMTMPYLPKREIWVDIDFFKNNIVALQKLSEQGVTMVTRTHRRYADIPNLIKYNSARLTKDYVGKEGITRNCIFYGKLGLVGTFALSLAVAELYDEIFLLGYDF